jgi:hypothetical protein
MSIQGTCVATFDQAVPIGMHGEWNIDVGIPVFRSNGQGDGTPGSGYNGSALGTKQDVSGAFKFVVQKSAQNVKAIIQRGLFGMFTINWPIGDPALGGSKAKAEDCHFDRLSFGANNPDGSFIISGTMTAGRVTGDLFRPET